MLPLGNASALAQGEDPPEPLSPIIEGAPPVWGVTAEASDGALTLFWQTKEPQVGWIEYGTSWDQMTSIAYDERGPNVADTQHRVVLNDLQPGTVIYYVVVSAGQRLDNGGPAFKHAFGGERFEIETTPEGVDAAQSPDMQVEPIGPAQPTGVTETQAGETQFVVEWQTIQPQTGWIEYGTAWDQIASIAYDERGSDVADTQHRVVVSGLEMGKGYYYVVVSDGERFDNGGALFKFTAGNGISIFPELLSNENVDIIQLDGLANTPDLGPDASSVITCDPEIFYGVQHCVDNNAHMLVVNLRDSHVRVQPVLSNGPNGECNSVNHVGKDATSNCPNPYPIEAMSAMLARYQARGGVAIIDADYSAMPAGDHGAEGLTVRNGVRLDGTAHGDNDGNATRRSSLAFSASKEARIGKPARESDIDPQGAYYNTVGGGPMIVRNGSALDNSACANDGLSTDVCTRLAQSAAGLTSDGRLILVTAAKDAAGMASYLVNNFHVQSAIKFDGGGSARMAWVDASGQIRQWGATSEDRRLPEGLLILSERRQTTDPDDNRILASGQTLNGTINPATDEDTYYFDGAQGQRATIRMNRIDSGSLDSFLYLYAPNGSLVAQDDDGGGNGNALISQATLPQSGRYRIVATSWSSRSTGAYSLGLELGGGGGGCTPGANGVILYEHLHAGRCVTFTGDHNDFNLNGFNDVASSIRFVGSYASGWEAQVFEHTYYGGVSSTYRGDDIEFGNDTIGHDRASSIRIRRISNDEPNDRFISSGQTLNGVIDPASDQDSFVFDASQGQRATIRMNRTSGSLDSFLYLYAPNGSLVTYDDDGGGYPNSLINQVALPQNGRYRIVAKSYNGVSTGGYALSLELGGSGGCTSSQYRAEYYNNRTLSGSPTLTQCEGWPINHDWGGGGPSGGVGNDNFSARWTGRASINAGRYTFIARSDDGIRVWLDNNLIIDAWRDQGPTEYRNTRDVSSGMHDIRVEYYENSGGAVAQFRWEPAASSGNLARGRPANATSQESATYAPAKGNDGNTGTRWSSQWSASPRDEWWWVDLGTQTFDQVVVRWEAAYATQYFIGWSDNGSNFTGYWYTANTAGTHTRNLGTRTARYVGILMRQRAPCCGNYSFWELEVYRTAALSAADAENVVEIAPDSDLVTITMP